jgi:hypothetical protein
MTAVFDNVGIDVVADEESTPVVDTGFAGFRDFFVGRQPAVARHGNRCVVRERFRHTAYDRLTESKVLLH